MNSGPLSVLETVRITIQVAEGLAAAHDQGLVHRDIKPANILLEKCVERVQITDFGLARAADDASMTRSGVIAGTPQYMSPEQAHGDEVDQRSDLFSLGSVIYFMLTGRSPFRAETTMGVLSRICCDQPRSLRSIHPDIPAWLENVVMRLLSKDRLKRFGTATELAEELHPWLAHLQSPTEVSRPTSGLRARLRGIPMRNRPSSAGSNSWPRWFVAIGSIFAIFAFGLAGIMILELGNGTLRIENNADVDVPIVIRRGEEIVDELTVSRKGLITRLRAGNYEIEVKDEHAEFILSGNEVTLNWRGQWLASISKDVSSAQTNEVGNSMVPNLPSTSELSEPAGRPLLFWLRASQGIRLASHHAPNGQPLHKGVGLTLHESEQEQNFTLIGPNEQRVACKLALSTHGHSDLFWQQLENAAVPLGLNLDEFLQAHRGETVTKVVSVWPRSVKPSFVTLQSGPSQTPAETVHQARQRGEIACILTIGGVQQTVPSGTLIAPTSLHPYFEYPLTRPASQSDLEDEIIVRSNGVKRSTIPTAPAAKESVLTVDLTADENIQWLFRRESDLREPFPFPMAVYSSYTASMELINADDEVVLCKMEVLCNGQPDAFWKRIHGIRLPVHLSTQDFERALNGATIRKIACLRPGEKATECIELDGRTEPLGNAEQIVSLEISPIVVPFSEYRRGNDISSESVENGNTTNAAQAPVAEPRLSPAPNVIPHGTAIVLVLDKISALSDGVSLPQCALSILDQLEAGDSLGILVQGETEPVWLWGGEDGLVKLDQQASEWRTAIQQAEIRETEKWADMLQRVTDALVDYDARSFHVILVTDNAITKGRAFANVFKELTTTASVIEYSDQEAAPTGNDVLPSTTNAKYYRTTEDVEAADIEFILERETQWAKGMKVEWDTQGEFETGVIIEYQDHDEGEPALLTTPKDVETHISKLIENRRKIKNSEVNLNITHSGRSPFTRRYHVWLNGEQKRSDCVGIHANGKSQYTHILTPQFNWYEDSLDPNSSQYSQSDPAEPVGWGTLGCILDLPKIGMVNWSIESLHSHAFDEDLWPENRERVNVTLGKHDGRRVTVVKIQCRNDRTNDSWTELRFDPSQGNYPVYIANGWADRDAPEKRYVIKQETNWQAYGEYWYPSSLTYEYTCEARKIRNKSIIEILEAKFDQEPFPDVFDPLESE